MRYKIIGLDFFGLNFFLNNKTTTLITTKTTILMGFDTIEINLVFVLLTGVIIEDLGDLKQACPCQGKLKQGLRD